MFTQATNKLLYKFLKNLIQELHTYLQEFMIFMSISHTDIFWLTTFYCWKSSDPLLSINNILHYHFQSLNRHKVRGGDISLKVNNFLLEMWSTELKKARLPEETSKHHSGFSRVQSYLKKPCQSKRVRTYFRHLNPAKPLFPATYPPQPPNLSKLY